MCKDNSWIHGKCRQRFLSNVYKRFFLFSPRFLRFCYFQLNAYYMYIYATYIEAVYIERNINLQT